ncbi:MAG: PEP-CTERM sorting domain-containing protein [Betaproteobacteria bacterium]
MKRLISVAALGWALASLPTPSAHADTVVLPMDGQWHPFDVDAEFAPAKDWIDLSGDALAFTFNAAGPVALTVLDGGFAGDEFEVFDHGVWLGFTSAAVDSYPDSFASTQAGFDHALADNRYSRRVFMLGAGAHSVTGLMSRSALDDTLVPLDATVGAVRIAAVPEPASWSLLAGGIAALVGAIRRREGPG